MRWTDSKNPRIASVLREREYDLVWTYEFVLHAVDGTSILSSFISSPTTSLASFVFLLVYNLYLPAFKPQCSCT